MNKPFYNKFYTPISNKKSDNKSKKNDDPGFFLRLKFTIGNFYFGIKSRFAKLNFLHRNESTFTSDSKNILDVKGKRLAPMLFRISILVLFLILGLLLVYYETNSKTFAVKNYDVEFEKLDAIEAPVLQPEVNKDVAFSQVIEDQGQVLAAMDETEIHELYAEKLERLKKEEEARRKAEEERRKLQAKIDNLDNFFAKYKSPLNGYADKVIEASNTCGFDYREILAISMKESGLGRVMNPGMKGTAWGYIDGVTGESWDVAIPRVMCAVAAKYVNKYGLSTTLARAYGPKSWTDAEAQVWINHVIGYKNTIP